MTGGGFACAVGAEEGDDFAGAEGEAEAVERAGGAVVLGDVVRVATDGCAGLVPGVDFGLVGMALSGMVSLLCGYKRDHRAGLGGGG